MYGEYQKDGTWKEMFLRTDGRLNRKRYIKRTLLLCAVAIVAAVITALLFTDAETGLTVAGSVVLLAVILGVYVVSFCLNVRRLHDLNMNKDLAVAIIVTSVIATLSEGSLISDLLSLFNFGVGIFLMAKCGTTGDNDYGADPLG